MKSPMLVIVAAVIAAQGLAAASQSQGLARDAIPAVAPPTGAGGLSGVVRDLAGQPVRRASVIISGDMRLERMTVSDSNGRFGFSGLPAGRFTVTAEKAGYPRMSYGAKRPYRDGAGVFLREGERLSNLEIRLARGAAMTGTVFDERGEPMPGVPLMAWQIRTALDGERTLDYPPQGAETVVTDDRGVYRVFGLAPGDYTIGTTWYFSGQGPDVRVPTEAEYLAAFPDPARPSATTAGKPAEPPGDTPRFNYSPVFSPGSTDPLAAATVTLGAGDEQRGVDLRMQFQPTSRINGTIVNPAGSPVMTQLMFTRQSPVKALNTTQVRPSQPDGRFTIDSVSPGFYGLLAETRGRTDGPALWAMADLTVAGGDVMNVTLSLQPALEVSGRVVFDGATLEPPVDLSRVSVRLRGTAAMSASTVSAVDAAGAISVSGVIPGPYTASGSVPGGTPAASASDPAWRVSSVTVGGRDVTDRIFDISEAGAADLIITFSDKVSTLSGTLTSSAGAPETDYFIIAIPDDREFWIPQSRRIASTRPDASGRYAFHGLPSGNYRIAVTTDLVPRDLQEVSTLEQLAAQSLATTIGPGEKKTLDIRTGR
jgi:Carboxypeptidase regulatory-like domain